MRIESGVPLPKDNMRGSELKYPFIDMEVGQSVFFEGESTRSKMQARAHQVAKRHGKKFVCRTMDGGLRIWRVE